MNLPITTSVRGSFAVLLMIRHHQSLVRRCLRRFGVQERDLPDAMQDVFIVVHRRLPTFEGRSRLSTWIYRIAFHVASEHRRRACNRREVLVDVEATTPLDDERRDTIEKVTRALSQLDPDRRDVLVDFELDEQLNPRPARDGYLAGSLRRPTTA